MASFLFILFFGLAGFSSAFSFDASSFGGTGGAIGSNDGKPVTDSAGFSSKIDGIGGTLSVKGSLTFRLGVSGKVGRGDGIIGSAGVGGGGGEATGVSGIGGNGGKPKPPVVGLPCGWLVSLFIWDYLNRLFR